MSSIATRPSEIQVLVTEESTTGQPNEVWRAVVLQMPHLTVQGQSRQDVISAIRKMLIQSVRHAEVVTFSLPDAEEVEDSIAAKGYRHYGILAEDSDALKLFDEIEGERNKHFIEPPQS